MSLEPITFDLDLRCLPEQAFDAFAVRMGQWWDGHYSADPDTFAGIETEPMPGGSVELVHSDGQRFPFGTVLVWEYGSRYAQTSTLAQTPEFPSEISVAIVATSSGCACHFEHGGWNVGNGDFRQKFRDWPHLLERFRSLANASASSSSSSSSSP